jgi:hypothetical protein
VITPAPSRATLEDTPDGLRVTIPAARKPVFASLLVIWLAFAVTFTRDLFAHVVTPADLAFALCVAAILLFWGSGAVITILDSLWGRDVLVAGAHSWMLRHEIRGIGRDRTYPLSDIGNLRVAPPLPDVVAVISPLGVFRKGNGWIAFDYSSATIRLGAGVDEAEARVIVQRLRPHERLPPHRSLG